MTDLSEVPASVVSQVLLAGWEGAHPTMARLLGPYLGGEPRALGLCRAWLPRPLGPTSSLPTELPDGSPLPPPATPWPRELSPLPGVDLDVDSVLALCLETLDPQGRPWRSSFQRLVAPYGGVPHFVRDALQAAWPERALPCLRHAYPPRPLPWLDRHELTAFLESARVLVPASHRGVPHRAWELLVLAGAEPQNAYDLLRLWPVLSLELPTGQWIPTELHPEHRRSLLRAGEYELHGPDLARIMLCLPARRTEAIARVEALLECPRDGALRLVEAIERAMPAGRRVTLDDDSVPTPLSPARSAFDAAVAALMVDLPFHWSLLHHTLVVETRRVDTMAVGTTVRRELVLFYDPGFVLGLSRLECQGVLVHELNHVILGHLDPPAILPKKHVEAATRGAGRVAWTYATECTANEFVPYPLPGEPIRIEGLGLPPMEGTAKRYARLLRRQQLPPIEPSTWLVAGTLSAHPRSPDEVVSPVRTAPSVSIRRALDEVGDQLDAQTRELLEAGNQPGCSELELASVGVAQLRWEQLLRVMARSLTTRRATRKYPNRRHPDRVGVVPGHRRQRELPVVLAVIDTSGSMADDELAAISTELQALVRLAIRVAIVTCDVVIHQQRWLERGEQLARFYGRGGTDLRPPFAPEVLGRFRPELLVYFTDGYGDAPEVAPVGVEVLWVLTGSHPQQPARWGRSVRMRERWQRAAV